MSGTQICICMYHFISSFSQPSKKTLSADRTELAPRNITYYSWNLKTRESTNDDIALSSTTRIDKYTLTYYYCKTFWGNPAYILWGKQHTQVHHYCNCCVLLCIDEQLWEKHATYFWSLRLLAHPHNVLFWDAWLSEITQSHTQDHLVRCSFLLAPSSPETEFREEMAQLLKYNCTIYYTQVSETYPCHLLF